MAVEFDPAWEYFVGHPEVEELTTKVENRSVFDARTSGRFVFNRRAPEQRSYTRMENFKEVFARMWLSGESGPSICDMLGICCLQTLLVWRKKLGLPARLPGNQPRARQVEHMRGQLAQ